MVMKRAAVATLVFAVIGLATAGNIAWVHNNLATNPGAASWCNINEELTCEVVLTSEYATVLGVSVAYWAILTYLAMIAAAVVVLRTRSATRRRQMGTLLLAVAIWGGIFSLYLAYVSFFILNTVCLMCSALYVVQLALLASTLILWTAVRTPVRGPDAWQGRSRLLAAVAGVAVLAVLGIVAWKGVQGEQVLTAQEIKLENPEFYAWYKQQPTVAAPLDGGHSKGQADALVTVIEFSDFECGHCANAYRSLKQVLPRYQKDVQLRFHHFPLDSACNPSVKRSMHQYACLAAQAAECAAAQGSFWEYHDLLFDNQSRLDRDSLIAYAERVGIDRAAFLSCLDSDAPRAAIARDVAEGMRLGIESTPTFYLNGRTITGAPRTHTLGYAIQLERAAKRGEG